MRLHPAFLSPIITGVVFATALRAQPAFTTVAIPMRDGHTLAADVYANPGTAAKPVILVQTPYDKNLYRTRLAGTTGTTGSIPYDSAAYQYVIVDWRGFHESAGAAVQGYDRGLDGYDCVEWIAAQPWCNGKIGTHGGSAFGAIQFLTAGQHPPHLVCAVPMVKDIRTTYADYYAGGVLRLEHVESLERLGFMNKDLITAQPVMTALWRTIDRNSDITSGIAIPMLIVGGWFDHFPDDVLACFEDLRTRSAASVRAQHKIIIGPWGHGNLGDDHQGELIFPAGGDVHTAAAKQFFDYHLRGAKNGWPLLPAVRWFQMGEDVWKETPSWTGLKRDSITLFVHADGMLSPAPPAETDAWSEVRADPRDPSPSYGGARFNPFDPGVKTGPLDIRSVVESRSDACVFTTDPLPADLVLCGAVTVHLDVSTDRADADVAVRLTDVHPDGRSMILTDGIRRLRFHAGEQAEHPVPPGTIVTATVLLQQFGLTLHGGHRLRLVVTPSNYPRYDRNLQNGGAMYTAGDTLEGRLCVHHNALHPSHAGIIVAAGTSAIEDIPVPYSVIHLGPPYPLPGHGTVTIPLTLQWGGDVEFTVCDLLGRTLVRSVHTALPSGASRVPLDLRGVEPGVHILRAHSTSGGVHSAAAARLIFMR